MHHLGIFSVLLHRIIVASYSNQSYIELFAFAFRTLSEIRISIPDPRKPRRNRSISFFLSLSLSQSIFPFFSCSLPNTRNPIAHTWPKYTHTHVLELGEHNNTRLDPPPSKGPRTLHQPHLGTLSVGIKNLAPENVQQPHPSTALEFRTRHVKESSAAPIPVSLPRQTTQQPRQIMSSRRLY